MNNHRYLRAYMAAIAVPTPILLVALTVFGIVRFACGVPVPLERLVIFPMAIVPNLFGVWNMLHLASRSRTRLPLGIHGAILPFLLVPAGFFLARALGVLQITSHGLIYFGLVEIQYAYVALIFTFGVIVYYLIWKYLIGFLNRVAGVAE
jgi:hypothetical protein